jgi:hypothetical protein
MRVCLLVHPFPVCANGELFYAKRSLCRGRWSISHRPYGTVTVLGNAHPGVRIAAPGLFSRHFFGMKDDDSFLGLHGIARAGKRSGRWEGSNGRAAFVEGDAS